MPLLKSVSHISLNPPGYICHILFIKGFSLGLDVCVSPSAKRHCPIIGALGSRNPTWCTCIPSIPQGRSQPSRSSHFCWWSWRCHGSPTQMHTSLGYSSSFESRITMLSEISVYYDDQQVARSCKSTPTATVEGSHVNEHGQMCCQPKRQSSTCISTICQFANLPSNTHNTQTEKRYGCHGCQ